MQFVGGRQDGIDLLLCGLDCHGPIIVIIWEDVVVCVNYKFFAMHINNCVGIIVEIVIFARRRGQNCCIHLMNYI